MPPEPHAVAAVPVTHTPAWQQPVGQVVASHVAVWHWPASQAPLPQLTQLAPPTPHALALMPLRHWPFASQQPSGQVALEHPPTHAWLLQLLPAAVQASHWLPPVPQALLLRPVTHTPF